MRFFRSLLHLAVPGVVFVLAGSLHQTAAEDANGFLSPSEARAIVDQELKAREDARQEKIRQLNAAQVIESSQAKVGDHQVIVNRVVAPVHPLPERTEPAAALAGPDSQSSPGTMPVMDPPDLPVTNRTITLSATVCDDRITELRWNCEGTPYHAFSNLNFKYLQPMGQIQAEDCIYTFIMAWEERTSESLRLEQAAAGAEPKWIPAPADFTSEAPEYLVISPATPQPSDERAFADMDMLHRYLAEHLEELKIAFQRSEALREAREAYLSEHPPVQRDTIINHWR